MVNLKFKNGFTLVEALAILAIAAIILAAATPVITKKHRRPTEVPHGRFECWWEGNQLKQRMVSSEEIIASETRDIPSGQSCTFNPPANVDKFLIQAVGGGGAGGGAGDSFMKSKALESRGNSGQFTAMASLNGAFKSSVSSPKNGTDGWPVLPDFFVKANDLKKHTHSTILKAKNWFEWDYLDTRKNDKAYDFVGVVCSGGGGNGAATSWNDVYNYYCVENETRELATTKTTSCGSCVKQTGQESVPGCSGSVTSRGSCGSPSTSNGTSKDCNCGNYTYYYTYYTSRKCSCTTDAKTGKETCSTCCDVGPKSGSSTAPCCIDRLDYEFNCKGDAYHSGCPAECNLKNQSVTNRGTSNSTCKERKENPCSIPLDTQFDDKPRSGQTGKNGGCGGDCYDNQRNNTGRSYIVNGGKGAPGKCTSAYTYITSSLTGNFKPEVGQGKNGVVYDDCPMATGEGNCLYQVGVDSNCPARQGSDGEDAEALITNGSNYMSSQNTDKSCLDGDGKQVTSLATIKACGGGGGPGGYIQGAKTDAFTKKIDYILALYLGQIGNTRYYLKMDDLEVYGDYCAAKVYDWACKPSASASLTGTAATIDPARGCDDAYGYCSAKKTGPSNHIYKWTRKYYTQWLNYGEVGEPGDFVSTYVSKINSELSILPGKGGDVGNWAQNTAEANGKDGKPTVIRATLLGIPSPKAIVSAKGGKGGEGAIKSDTYTMCSRGMYRLEPGLCAELVSGIPQRKLHTSLMKNAAGNEILMKKTTGLEKFHAAFDMKENSNLGKLTGADTFGVGGTGQGSKSRCDSAMDWRQVWNVDKPNAYVYDNSVSHGQTGTQSTDSSAVCDNTAANYTPVYFMPDGSGDKIGTAYVQSTGTNTLPDYAPKRGGDGAVIITW